MKIAGCFLYRHYDEAGQLLYCGISVDAITRQGAHERRAGWFKQVRRIEITPYSNSSEALAAEAAAIKAERPRWNTVHAVTKPVDVPIAEARQGAALLRRLHAGQRPDGAENFSARSAQALAELEEVRR